MSELTRADVEHVAQLARLALDDDELERSPRELGAILDHAAQVSALDTAGVPPTAHPLPLVNVLRADDGSPESRPRRGARDGARRPRTAASACRASSTHRDRPRARARRARRRTIARSTCSRSTSR